MNTTPCHLCGATMPRHQQTPTLIGVRLLCAHCRNLYREAIVDAIVEFHHRQQRTSPPSVPQSREAA
jgi:hypothetical protein